VIDWKPIASIPSGLKDGREVLLGYQWGEAGNWSAVVAVWKDGILPDWQLAETGFRASDADLSYDPTHYAEINPPSHFSCTAAS